MTGKIDWGEVIKWAQRQRRWSPAEKIQIRAAASLTIAR
jgi:hypothetical protein